MQEFGAPSIAAVLAAIQALDKSSGLKKLFNKPAALLEAWMRVRPGENFLLLFGYKKNGNYYWLFYSTGSRQWPKNTNSYFIRVMKQPLISQSRLLEYLPSKK